MYNCVATPTHYGMPYLVLMNLKRIYTYRPMSVLRLFILYTESTSVNKLPD